MKYFFLSQGWQVTRVWETSGLWNERVWRRKPLVAKMGVYIVDKTENMALYKVEDAVQMVEVMPDEFLERPTNTDRSSNLAIGKVRITRLVSAEQVLERISPIH
ncbi:hypothetical protein V2H45_01550 [Tumidithrix elongata RA019]|uniref:Uncharacterized protein n=1 Tax=Tumidithrix elongata BACA0141 TaxID=2716417 RepID=A0AAW9PWV8_9CYAN|nr:hypothetical protein [Tumidithrix elongata RA019]